MTQSLPPSPPTSKTPQSRARHIAIFLLVLGLAAVIAWMLAPSPTAHGQNAGHGRGAHADAVTPVAVAAVKKGDIDILRHALGTVTPLATVTVRTQINGLLMEIGFQEGQIVHKGDFLAQIDPRPYQNTLEQATGALQRDQALLKDAQLNLDRFKKLLAQDSISKQQVDTQESLVNQDSGNVLADQSQIDSAQLNLTYAHITAPVTGRVGLRQVDAGNYVQTSDAGGIVTITELQPITVVFTLPEDDVPTVMKLYNDGAELPATAYDRTQSAKLATGRLIAVDNQIDPTTGTVKLKAEFDNQDNALFPNQFVNVELKITTQHDALLVPAAAIQRGTMGTFVYKLKDDNTVTVTPVKLGAAQGDTVAIAEGLAEGDKVVTQGIDKLRDGAHVAVK
jgi:multidrug efflux system membrane fusion protein